MRTISLLLAIACLGAGMAMMMFGKFDVATLLVALAIYNRIEAFPTPPGGAAPHNQETDR